MPLTETDKVKLREQFVMACESGPFYKLGAGIDVLRPD